MNNIIEFDKCGRMIKDCTKTFPEIGVIVNRGKPIALYIEQENDCVMIKWEDIQSFSDELTELRKQLE